MRSYGGCRPKGTTNIHADRREWVQSTMCPFLLHATFLRRCFLYQLASVLRIYKAATRLVLGSRNLNQRMTNWQKVHDCNIPESALSKGHYVVRSKSKVPGLL